MVSKLCDSCKSATAALFCRADSAFLCVSCDGRIHAANNNLASRHARVVLCEVCEQSPAHVTCKADAASLCLSCDRLIHSANPVAQKHDQFPVTPFYDSVAPVSGPSPFKSSRRGAGGFHLGLSGEEEDEDEDDVGREEDEVEAASWLLPNPKAVDESAGVNSAQYLLGDADYRSGDRKFAAGESNSSGSDGVVPVRRGGAESVHSHGFPKDGELDLDFHSQGGYGVHCLSHNLTSQVPSSSLEVGLVPDGNKSISGPDSSGRRLLQLSPADREARVLRYREKRKNRKFEKTIRYASRKAYAETRPRIKGRFAKRTDAEAEAEAEAETDSTFGFGVVPTI